MKSERKEDKGEGRLNRMQTVWSYIHQIFRYVKAEIKMIVNWNGGENGRDPKTQAMSRELVSNKRAVVDHVILWPHFCAKVVSPQTHMKVTVNNNGCKLASLLEPFKYMEMY